MALPPDINSMNNLFMNTKIDETQILDLWSSWQLTTKIKDQIKGEAEVLIEEGDSWHTISELVYGSRKFWWVLALYNEVDDPFSIFFDSKVDSSTHKIKIIKPEYLDIIIRDIRRQRVEKENNRFDA